MITNMYGDNPLGDLNEKCQESPSCFFDDSAKLWKMCSVHIKAVNSSNKIKNPIALRNLVTRYDGRTFVKEHRFFVRRRGQQAKLIEIKKREF